MLARLRTIWNLLHGWWEYKMVQLLWKTIWWFQKKLNIELSNDPVILVLCILSKELKICVQTSPGHTSLAWYGLTIYVPQNHMLESQHPM